VKYVPLVWAAIWRNRTESLLTLFALTVAFTLFGAMLTLNDGYERAINDARSDRLSVTHRFGGGAMPFGYREQLSRIAGVVGVGGQLELGGHEQDGHHQISVMFVDDGMRRAWPEIPMTPAQWQALSTTPTGIFLTHKAAARRQTKIGSVITLDTGPGSRADGGGTWFFTVLGLIPDPPAWGQVSPDLIIGNLHYFEEAGDLDERNLVNMFRVAVDRPEHAASVCREIETWYTNANPPLTCVPARENAQELAQATINMRQISLGIGAAGLFMILFLAANGMADSVRERASEFGVLKAMGYNDGALSLIVFLEAAGPTMLAVLLGLALTFGVDALITRLAVNGVLNLPDMRVSPTAFGEALVAALLIALVSTLAPLQRIRHMDVAAVMAGK
jgi:putative ABC transport system permease protein